MEKGISRFVLISLMLGALSLSIQTQAKEKARPTYKALPGELIIKLKEHQGGASIQSTAIQSLSKALGEEKILDIHPLLTNHQFTRIKITNEADIAKAVKALKANSNIEYVQRNYEYRALDMPNDPEFAKLWGLQNTGTADNAGQMGREGSDINVLPLWDQGIVGSQDILVAVIDTGVNWTHPDLVGNVYTNPGEIAGNNIDDDNNGFVDDIHGWNFSNDTSNANSNDDHFHGSHCAGTIGATGNNGQGVVGVNWQVKILPVKFLNANGSGSSEGAINAINYARTMHPKIMSNSWGGGPFEQALLDAITAARDEGILFVAAAGNDYHNNNDENPTYPATYDSDNVLAVAATDNRDILAEFSNFGPTKVHVAAPGVNIYSTGLNSAYRYASGTSMATPHVAGAAALVWSAHPEWTYAEVKDWLIRTSHPTAGLRGKVVANGRIDVNAAVNMMVPPPPPPPPAETEWVDMPMMIETPHPYADSQRYEYNVSVPNARWIRIVFDTIDVEVNYDYIHVMNDQGEEIETYNVRNAANMMTQAIPGDRAQIVFTTDSSVVYDGFRISRIQYVPQQQ